jgi:hypothetical protein
VLAFHPANTSKIEPREQGGLCLQLLALAKVSETIDSVMITLAEVTTRLRSEIDAIIDPGARRALQPLLIDPIQLCCA